MPHRLHSSNTACTGQVRAAPALSGKQPQEADSASGGFARQIPPLPVTPAVGQFLAKQSYMGDIMRYFFVIAAVVMLVLTSCGTGVQSDGLTVTETGKQTITSTETIHLNNCGGKAETEQTAVRSFSINTEGEVTVKVGYEVVEGGVSAKYGQQKNISKSQTLKAPAGTNMNFILQWTEQQWLGQLISGGQSGTYSASAPIAVELISSEDLGCNNVASPNNTNSPVTFSVYANQGWQNAGISVKNGDRVNIQYISGLWFGNHDANGGPEYWTCSLPQCHEPSHDFPKYALIGKIGDNGSVIKVGGGLDFIADTTGVLYLRPNYGDVDIPIFNPQGAVTMEISVQP